MKRYLITGISRDMNNRFTGFRLYGIVGDVDPFVDGHLIVDELRKFEDDSGYINDTTAFLKAELEWAKLMIGKSLVCDDLHYKAFATCGNVSFE